jgi:LL-diaminopimelate aminotransferase
MTLDSLKPASPEKLRQLRESLADWLTQYHGSPPISPREIYLGNGISSIIHLVALTFIDTGDVALVPSVGVPLYRQAVTAAGGIAVPYPLSARRDWLPDIDKMSTRIGQAARVLFVNSPHNPTGTDLDEHKFHAFVSLASKQNTLLVNDACYQSVPSRKPLSLLSIDGGRKVGLEVYSLAHLFGLPPIPFGFAVGHRSLISGLEQAGSVFGQYVPELFVNLAFDGLKSFPSKSLEQARKQFAASASAAQPFLEQLGLETSSPLTIPFIWAPVPGRRNSVAFARMLLKRYRILVAPGSGFGDIAQGYVRLSLTVPKEQYAEGIKRVSSRPRLSGRRETP